MKSNSDVTRKSNSSAPGQSNPGQSGNPVGNGYAPSVPITVYRELAAELQATKAMMESMNAQSQHLVRQNHLLRQEIERLVHSALSLQQIVGTSQANTATLTSTPAASVPTGSVSASNPEAIAELVRQSTRSAQPRTERPAQPRIEHPAEPPTSAPSSKFNMLELDPPSNDLFSEIAQEPHRPEKRPAPKNMGGFWLTATIAVIVVTAFGAGFLVVRPLLPGR